MIGPFKDKYKFLSNFYPVDFEFNGFRFKSVEHAYCAYKATNDEDFESIRTAETAGKAKKLGREIKVRKDWNDLKVDLMRKFLKLKFQNPELKQLLLETGNEELVELNWWNDTFWGVDDKTMLGKNTLGILLMDIREDLRGPNGLYKIINDYCI